MSFTTRPTLEGSFGMVSSTHWLASQSAMGILERGGNAFDAATTAGFVLHVVEPHLNGPGGEVPAIIARAGADVPKVLAGQGPAPANATIEVFQDRGYTHIPASGPLAAAVPMAVDAWLLLLRDEGTMALRDILSPAIHYARHGAPMVGRVGSTIATVEHVFREDWPTSAAIWLPDGHVPGAGQVVRNDAYADTLERLVRESEDGGGSREEQIDRGRRVWREGFVADAIVEFLHEPVRAGGGEPQQAVMDDSDLAGAQATWEDPQAVQVGDDTVYKTGPWGQGPWLLQAFQILQELGDLEDVDLESAAGIHTVVEVVKLCMADREAWFGDSAEVPITDLLSREYARERAQLVGDESSLELRPGSPGGRAPKLPSLVLDAPDSSSVPRDVSAGEPTVQRDGATRGDTCHVDVVDRWGNMISATPSGGWLQSNPAVPGLGFPLGSRMQMFWLEPGLPASLKPGVRPRTTLTPSLVFGNGTPYMVCGSPGGDQQDQWQLVFLLRVLVRDMSLQEAIDAPMFHTTSFPGSFFPRLMEPGVLLYEDRLDENVAKALGHRGHRLLPQGPWSLGRLCAVTRDSATGILRAGANPRGMQGYAVGR